MEPRSKSFPSEEHDNKYENLNLSKNLKLAMGFRKSLSASSTDPDIPSPPVFAPPVFAPAEEIDDVRE